MDIIVKLAPAAVRRWKSVDNRMATVSIVPVEEAPRDFVPVENRAIRLSELFKGVPLEGLPAMALRVEAVMPGGTRLEEQFLLGRGGNKQLVILGARLGTPLRRRRDTIGQEYAAPQRTRDSGKRAVGEALSALALSEIARNPSPAADIPLSRAGLEQLGLGGGFVERTFDLRDSADEYQSGIWFLTREERPYEDGQNRLPVMRGHIGQRGWWAHVDFFAPIRGGTEWTQMQRRFAVMETSKATFIVPLLGRRRFSPDEGLHIRANARVRLAEGKHVSPTVEVTSTDATMSSVLDLLQHGEVAAAKGVLDTASMLLFLKFENPYLASLGAHVLLGIGEIRKSATWHRWVQNLVENFEHIPDGIIVLAALVLRRAGGLREEYQSTTVAEAVEKAKKLCALAMTKGPPHFVVSIRLLAENLSLIASYEHGNEAHSDTKMTERMLRSVQWLGAHTDARQGIAVLKLDNQEQFVEESLH